jgi:hypothetical protein
LLVGISGFFGSILVCFTVVGLPLGIAGFMLWLVMLFSAQVVFGGVIGRWILGPTEDTWGRVGRMALGMAIVGIIVPILHQVHILDLLFRLAAMIWGFGAIALTLYRRLQKTSGVVLPPMVA